MSDAKDLKQIIRLLVADGWERKTGRSTHVKLTHPELGRLTFPTSPGGGRSFLNSCADINRLYRAHGLESPLRRGR